MHCYVVEQCEEDGSSLYIEHGICAFVLNWVYGIVEMTLAWVAWSLATIQSSIAIDWDMKLFNVSSFHFFPPLFWGVYLKAQSIQLFKYSATWIKSRWYERYFLRCLLGKIVAGTFYFLYLQMEDELLIIF